MIYFLSVLHLLFLLISVSSKQCQERNIIHLSGGIKEASQTPHSYGIISTPEFPHAFQTPFVQTWVIDASNSDNDTQINLYLTQMYLSQGVRFFQRSVASCPHVRRRQGQKKECRKSDDQYNEEIHVQKLHDLLRISTTCPYLEIEVSVPRLYGYHYRTRDPFLFHVYGFNITYEIVPEYEGMRNDSCYPRNCSNLGHCYLRENWRDFFCDCLKDHPGRYCQYSEQCNPEKNVSFCRNGGQCKIIGSGDGYCECAGTNFTGPKCERSIEQPTVSARTGCSNEEDCPLEENIPGSCSVEQSPKPCSCRPKQSAPADWVKYEGIVSISPNYSVLLNQTTIGYEMQSNISNWLRLNNVTILSPVFVRFYPYHGEYPYAQPRTLLLHFRGPLQLKDRIQSLLSQWLGDRKTVSYFYKLIPLLRKTFSLKAMPRLKFKSLEVEVGQTGASGRLKIDKSVSLTCTATTGASQYYLRRDIHFKWYKDGMPINKTIATRAMTDSVKLDGDEALSVLTIYLVTSYDGGTYECEVTDKEFGDQECGKKDVEVILPPQVEIEPMSLTLEKRKLRDGAVITCTDGSYTPYNPYNKSTEFIWARSRNLKQDIAINDTIAVLEDIIPQGKLLRILEAEQTEEFKCTAINKNGEERHKWVKVNVLDSRSSPSCNRQLDQLAKLNSIRWEWTAPGSIAMTVCPKGYLGYVQRPCYMTDMGKAQWGRTDFSRCISEELAIVNNTLQNARRGFGDWQEVSAVNLVKKVDDFISNNPVMYPGEGEKIVSLMEDIIDYANRKGKVNDLLNVFYRAVGKLLKVPNSCVHEKTVMALCELIAGIGIQGAIKTTIDNTRNHNRPLVIPSDVLLLQILPISVNESYKNYSYKFPEKSPASSWLNDKVQVQFPLDSEAIPKESKYPVILLMAAYKNISSLLAPNDIFPRGTSTISSTLMGSSRSTNEQKKPQGLVTSKELISPVIQIFMPDKYFMPENSFISIHFNLSKEHQSIVRNQENSQTAMKQELLKKGTYFSCGKMEHSSSTSDPGRLRSWSMNKCALAVHSHGSYVECQCDELGIYGLVKVVKMEDETPEDSSEIAPIIFIGFSLCILSCVISATLLVIYLGCRLSLNSLYTLKLLDCFFIFSAVFIILLGRTDIPSSSLLAWSATACSCIISSLSVQVTKVLRILLMETKSDLPRSIFPWLKKVSQLTILAAITFSTVLPVWTATVAKMIEQNVENESAFEQTSQVFFVFAGTVGLVVAVFLVIYYKAVLKTKGEMNSQQNCSSTSVIDATRALSYRMKTLNHSFSLCLILLVLSLAIVLSENLPQRIYIQYFLGFTTITMGVALFICYVTHSEYPILKALCVYVRRAEKPPMRDPEVPTQSGSSNGSLRHLYSQPLEAAGNGSIAGTIGLLPPPPPPAVRIPILNSLRQESEAFSVSTVEEQSMDTFSTDISFRPPPPAQAMQRLPAYNNKKRRSQRSTGGSTVSSSGSSYRSRRNPSISSSERGIPDPVKIQCLLTMSTGDYIYPTNHNSRPPLVGDKVSGTTSDSSTAASAIVTTSNYIPINDHHEDFQFRDNLNETFD